jgi:hypothetical protein
MVVPNSFQIIIAGSLLTHINVLSVHIRLAESEVDRSPPSCSSSAQTLMSPFGRIEFGCGYRIFGKCVDPCSSDVDTALLNTTLHSAGEELAYPAVPLPLP